jgi:transposase
MSPPRFTPEFKDEAVRQIIERGYSVAEVSARLGVSAHSLYKWVNAVNLAIQRITAPTGHKYL